MALIDILTIRYFETDALVKEVEGPAHLGDGPLMNNWVVETGTGKGGTVNYTCVPFARVISIYGPIPELFIVPDEQYVTMAKLRDVQNKQDIASLERESREADGRHFG